MGLQERNLQDTALELLFLYLLFILKNQFMLSYDDFLVQAEDTLY